MAIEDMYRKIVNDLQIAKKQLADAKEIQEFAKDAGLVLTIDETKILELEGKIDQMEDALIKRGYTIA